MAKLRKHKSRFTIRNPLVIETEKIKPGRVRSIKTQLTIGRTAKSGIVSRLWGGEHGFEACVTVGGKNPDVECAFAKTPREALADAFSAMGRNIHKRTGAFHGLRKGRRRRRR